MKIKQLWIAFLACVALVVVWFTFDASYKVYQWGTQTRSTHFTHKGEKAEGSTIFEADRYRNKETANHFLDQYKEKNWTVWYSPFQLENSTIDRFFPLKSCIYTAIVWCIFIYFIWLGYYVGKYYR